jgi:hypothetical protein
VPPAASGPPDDGAGAPTVLALLRWRRPGAFAPGSAPSYSVDMKKLLVLIVVVALAAFAVKKLQDA